MKFWKITAGLCTGVLAFSGVTGGLPAGVLTVSAADELPTSGTCGENQTWTLDDEGTLTINGTGCMKNYCHRERRDKHRQGCVYTVIEEPTTWDEILHPDGK